MWSSIENLKQNLNKIALDVHEEDDEDEDDLAIYDRRNIYDSRVSSSASTNRRNSHRFAHSNSASLSPLPNGTDFPIDVEIDQYKAEIRRLKESESELKASSVNYAALMKEKEDQISRLNQENVSLKQNLVTTRNENSRALANIGNVLEGSGDQSPRQQHRSTTQVKSCYSGNHTQKGVSPKLDAIANGIVHAIPPVNSQRKDQELADLLEEKNRSMAAMQATHEQQLMDLRMELEKEHNELANLRLKLQEEQQLNESFREELHTLKLDKKETSEEMSKLHSELNKKISELKQLQSELSRLGDEDADSTVKSFKKIIAVLEKENADLKVVKNKLEDSMQKSINLSLGTSAQDVDVNSSESSRLQEMEVSLQKLEKDLKQMTRERDKALQELKRLKQHLLEKASEEAEKMDEDSKIIEELRQTNEYQKAQLSELENALKQAIASKEEGSMIDKKEIQKSKETIEDLNRQLANFMSTIDLKNVEILNLQTALGQYFAEIEAKEHLEQQLALAREESSKISKRLKDAEQGMESSRREKDEVVSKLSHTEKMLAEVKNRVNKLEEDNAKLRRALEQSMTRLNRMSVDSDFLVDRRIVIKLLVTYFQRNHSKEVLDLMVRMLGFSDEDKQRIGVAQQGGKGVVRGVLGLSGRLVGGILGRSSCDVHATAASENQSFADLWVDFLLKETEERETREYMDDETARQKEDSKGGRSPNATTDVSSLLLPNYGTSPVTTSISRQYVSPTLNSSPPPPPGRGNLQSFEHSDSEFSTIPLTSLDTNSRFTRLLQKH